MQTGNKEVKFLHLEKSRKSNKELSQFETRLYNREDHRIGKFVLWQWKYTSENERVEIH